MRGGSVYFIIFGLIILGVISFVVFLIKQKKWRLDQMTPKEKEDADPGYDDSKKEISWAAKDMPERETKGPKNTW